MGGAADSSAAANGGRPTINASKYTEKREKTEAPGSDGQVARDLHDAWRLAFVVVADEDLATKAVTKAFIDTAPAEPVSSPSRLELLAATLRIGLTRAAESPDREGTAVTTALWQLPAEQRAALWLAKVNQLDNFALGEVLGLTAPNAGHVATRAGEWLDVALDHESGPLCQEEARLADFVGGHLDATEAAEMGQHIPDCPTCKTKVKAFAELADLKAVLVAAVPEPPASLAIETLEHQERMPPTNGTATLAEPTGRTPAVRALALCCAALIVLALVGLSLIRPAKPGSEPVVHDPRAIVPGTSATPGSGGIIGSTVTLPDSTASATTITVTTSTLPAVTFPTIPAGGTRKGKP